MAVKYGYSPMGTRPALAGDEQVAGMFKKLASRSGASVSVPNEAQSPQAKSAVALEWNEPVWTKKPAHGYIISADERYMIDKAENTYSAYRRGTRFQAGIPLGFTNDIDSAKALCNAHAREGD